MSVMSRAHLEFRMPASQLRIVGLPPPLQGTSNLDLSLSLLSGRLDLPPTAMDSVSYGSFLSPSLRRPFESLLSAHGPTHLELSPSLRALSKLGSTTSCLLAAASGRVGAVEIRLGDVCSVRGMAHVEVSFPAPDCVRLDVSLLLRGSGHVTSISVLETYDLGVPPPSRSTRLGSSMLSLGLSRAGLALSAAAGLHLGPSSPLKALP